MPRFEFFDPPRDPAADHARGRADAAFARLALRLEKLREVAVKHDFNPAEARIPAGNPGGGRWTRIGGGFGDGYARVAGNRGGSGSGVKKTITYRAGDGSKFSAPPGADFHQVYEYGRSMRGKSLLEKENAIRKGIAQGGIFDFQRADGRFDRDYTDAANYGVGVLMNGAGFSWIETLAIASGYAALYSKPRYDPVRIEWWKRGYDDAANGRLPIR